MRGTSNVTVLSAGKLKRPCSIPSAGRYRAVSLAANTGMPLWAGLNPAVP